MRFATATARRVDELATETFTNEFQKYIDLKITETKMNDNFFHDNATRHKA